MTKAKHGPDFLVVGAQRAGTTWLHRVLIQHPALWLPPVKELHYFDRPQVKRSILDRRKPRALASKHYLSLVPWLFNYYFRSRNDEWYATLFRPAHAKGLIAGEITPAYATLSENTLCQIKRINDEVKLIYIMRDPVDRAWSAIVYNASKQRRSDPLTVQRALKRAHNAGTAARSDYSDTIARLESVFSPGQLHYCFFDDLCSRPEAFVSELLSFLGIAPDASTQIEFPEAVNVAARSKAAPLAFSQQMAGEYLPMVEQLCRRFPGPPHRWRERYKQILDGV